MNLKNCFNKIYLSALVASLSILSAVYSDDYQLGSYGCEEPSFCNEWDCTSLWSQGRFHASGDLLYWTARQQGLDVFMGTGVSTVDGDGSSVTTTSTKSLNSDWRPGFRVGLGYQLCSKWDVSAAWTHYNGHAQCHGSGPSDVPPLSTSGKWKLDYNLLDVVLTSPNYCSNSCFTYHYLAGLRAASVDQKLNTTLALETILTDVTTDITELSSHIHFKGIGPEFGLGGAWHVINGFSLYGDVKTSFLFGRCKEKTTILSITTTAPITSDVTLSTPHTCQVVVDLGAGVCWDHHLCFGNYETDLHLKLGWEHAQWFNFNLPAFSIFSQNADFTTDGVTFSAGLDF